MTQPTVTYDEALSWCSNALRNVDLDEVELSRSNIAEIATALERFRNSANTDLRAENERLLGILDKVRVIIKFSCKPEKCFTFADGTINTLDVYNEIIAELDRSQNAAPEGEVQQ